MRGALRSEYGARCLYPLLARLAREPELRRVLQTLDQEQRRHVERLRRLMETLGARPASGSLRRALMAWFLFLLTPIVGMRFALRLCCDAQQRVSRWYHGYGAWFAGRGDAERARRCQELSATKWTHAQVLEAFVEHGGR